jgi:hypothetical protein
MNAKQMFVASVMVASIAAAIAPAAHADGGLTRGEVKAQVLQARAAGQLRPAGEAVEPYSALSSGPARSREQVRAEVLQARASGELVPAGEAVAPFETPTPSILARATVKEEYRMARMRGELTPDGEGFASPSRPSVDGHGHTIAMIRR